jgi:hypothetical protein
MERFWSKVNIGAFDSCWEWSAGINEKGYGRFRVGQKQARAHRISWELCFGKVSENLCVLHKCDNRKCVNPNHLFLGTAQDNANDMSAKWRNQTVVNKEIVKKIKEMRLAGSTGGAIAKQLGLKNRTVYYWLAKGAA